ncbi:MAG: hypothetical protein GY801_01190 [bacterium]|nr:hypothetical protein [bacterium]
MNTFKESTWKLYICAIPFQRLWELPYVGHQLQLPEIIFLPFSFVALRNAARLFSKEFWRLLDIAVLLWPLVKVIPCIHNGINRTNILDIAGAIYLVILYFFIRLIIDRRLLRQIQRLTILSALIAGILGGIGWSLSMFFDIHTRLSWPATIPYPYLGYIARAQAFTASPNMLASILMIGIIFQYSLLLNNKSGRGKALGVLGFLLLCFLLTFSKTIMCLIAGLVIASYAYYTKKKPQTRSLKIRILVYGAVLVCVLIYILGSHIVIARNDPEALAGFYEKSYISLEPLWNFRLYGVNYAVYATNYLHNKFSSLHAIVSSRGWGVGPGGYNAFIGELQALGKHPASFPQWDPHSTYFGILAELGILGLAELMVMWGLAAHIILKQLGRRSDLDPLVFGLAGIFMAIAVEAIATDVMNFRQYWWLLAVTSGLNFSTDSRDAAKITAIPE